MVDPPAGPGGDVDGLPDLLARLPSSPPAAADRAVLNAFLLAADDERVVLVVGHLRMTLPATAVLDVEFLDPAAEPAVPMVRVTCTLPLRLLDVCESLPDDVVVAAGRPFVTATRPRPPQYCHPAGYRELERDFLAARGIQPPDP